MHGSDRQLFSRMHFWKSKLFPYSLFYFINYPILLRCMRGRTGETPHTSQKAKMLSFSNTMTQSLPLFSFFLNFGSQAVNCLQLRSFMANYKTSHSLYLQIYFVEKRHGWRFFVFEMTSSSEIPSAHKIHWFYLLLIIYFKKLVFLQYHLNFPCLQNITLHQGQGCGVEIQMRFQEMETFDFYMQWFMWFKYSVAQANPDSLFY